MVYFMYWSFNSDFMKALVWKKHFYKWLYIKIASLKTMFCSTLAILRATIIPFYPLWGIATRRLIIFRSVKMSLHRQQPLPHSQWLIGVVTAGVISIIRLWDSQGQLAGWLHPQGWSGLLINVHIKYVVCRHCGIYSDAKGSSLFCMNVGCGSLKTWARSSVGCYFRSSQAAGKQSVAEVEKSLGLDTNQHGIIMASKQKNNQNMASTCNIFLFTNNS